MVQWSAVSSPPDSAVLLGAVAVSNHAVDILPEAIPCVRYCVALVTLGGLQISGAHEPIDYMPRETSIRKFNQLAHGHSEQYSYRRSARP